MTDPRPFRPTRPSRRSGPQMALRRPPTGHVSASPRQNAPGRWAAALTRLGWAAALLLCSTASGQTTSPPTAPASPIPPTPPNAPIPDRPAPSARPDRPAPAAIPPVWPTLPPTPNVAAQRPLAVVEVRPDLTIVLQGPSGQQTVSLLGIEPPLPSAAGPSAGQAFLSTMLKGEWVCPIDDGGTPAPGPAPGPGTTRPDPRTPRSVYLYRWPDGLNVNLELIRQGQAREQADRPYAFQDAFRAVEAIARNAGRGLWAPPPPRPDAKPDTKPDTKPDNRPDKAPDAKPAGQPESQPGSKPEVKPDTKPAPAGVTVFASRSGTKYHRDTCRFLGRTKDPLTIAEAKARGLGPCSECKPPNQ